MLRVAIAALLALLLLAPVASAKETLASLEEVHQGVDRIWDVTILHGEDAKPHAIIFRNAVGSPFGIVVYDAQGAEVYTKNGSRGVQTLPALPAGEYRFFVRGNGAFQVTDRAFERDNLTNVSATLDGAADTYVLSPRKAYNVGFTGSANIEWFDLTTGIESLTAPTNKTAKIGGAYIITMTGAQGAAYGITLDPADAAAPGGSDKMPGLGLAAMVAALGLAALARRKR